MSFYSEFPFITCPLMLGSIFVAVAFFYSGKKKLVRNTFSLGFVGCIYMVQSHQCIAKFLPVISVWKRLSKIHLLINAVCTLPHCGEGRCRSRSYLHMSGFYSVWHESLLVVQKIHTLKYMD